MVDFLHSLRLHRDCHVDSALLNPSMASLGVPVKLLHEAVGHIVTVETKGGQMYRGKLLDGQALSILF
jgi:hypothetical protein